MIAMLILMLLNAFVFPSLMTPRVTEVSYDKSWTCFRAAR